MVTVGWLLSTAMFVSGCPTGNDTLQDWIGHHHSELVQTWGAPSQETTLPDGGRLVLYSHTWDNGYGRHICRREFVTDAQGVIRSSSSKEC
jgi:hypothetical protein